MNFDLNIDNYSKSELAQMFNLPEQYSADIIEIHGSKIKEDVAKDATIGREKRTATLDFLERAQTELLRGVDKVLNDAYNTSTALESVRTETSRDVQVRETKPFIHSQPNEFYPGIINPIDRKINTSYLNIDSQFRENYHKTYSSNFHVTLPMHINNVLSMSAESVEIPRSYYSVSEQNKNNCFSIKVGESFKLVIIPNGSYTFCEIIETINAILKAEGGDFLLVKFEVVAQYENGNGPTKVFIDPLYIHLGLTIELNFQPSDSYQCLPLLFGWMLGFRKAHYVDESSYVSEAPISICGPKYVYLVVNDFNSSAPNSFYGAFTSSILNQNILAKVTMPNIDTATTTQSVSAYNPVLSSLRKYYGPVNLYKLQIQLLDEYGRIVNLNGMDYSFCLTLQTAYDV
jgi:hypothetical protein